MTILCYDLNKNIEHQKYILLSHLVHDTIDSLLFRLNLLTLRLTFLFNLFHVLLQILVIQLLLLIIVD